MDIAIFTHAAMFTFGLQWTGWLVAYALETETFYDILGGLNYLYIAYAGYSRNQPRLTSMTCLFVISRGWLLLFLAWRAHSRKGDARFDGVKDNFALFGVYWTVQGFWVGLISLPLLVVQALGSTKALTAWDQLMLLGFGAGIVMEVVADVQKTIWVEQGREGGFCTVGLWKYSRHPNYCGEIMQWLCAWLFSCFTAAASDSYTVPCLVGSLSPIFTMHILLNTGGTGIMHAEGKNLKRYYESDYSDEFHEYWESTSPVVPMIGYKDIPVWVKSVFLFEWKRYEYKPKRK